jgi:acetylglutamate kinase
MPHTIMKDLIAAAPHVRLQRGRVLVVKVGGSCLQRRSELEGFCEQIAAVHAFGARPVVVHGGGPQADALQRALGEEPRKVDGRRVTSATAMRAVRMSMAGELNTELAAALTAAGSPAIGVCAASAGIAVATRRPPMPTTSGVVDFGEVGDLASVDPAPLLALLDNGDVPVVCPPAGDGAGGFLNVNADLLAAELAIALGADRLVLATGAAGILRDPANPNSLLSVLSLGELRALRAQGALVEGMLVKAAAIERALTGGVPQVHVIGGSDPRALLVELYTNHGAGTMVTPATHGAEPEVKPATRGAATERTSA